MEHTFEINQELLQNGFKINPEARKNKGRRPLERVSETKWLLEAPRSFRKTKTMARGPPLGLSIGFSLRAALCRRRFADFGSCWALMWMSARWYHRSLAFAAITLPRFSCTRAWYWTTMLEACANGSSTVAFKHDLLVIVFNRTHKYPKGTNTTPQIQKQAKTLVGWDGAVLFSVISIQWFF